MSGLTASTVVVPVDFSDMSWEAVETAISITGDATKVHIVNVIPDLEANEPGVIWDVVDNESRAAHVEKALHEKLGEEKFKAVKVAVAFGDAGSEITDYAQANGADLIVIPSHGRRGIERLFMGSVAERVVRLAHCPVLVLRK